MSKNVQKNFKKILTKGEKSDNIGAPERESAPEPERKPKKV